MVPYQSVNVNVAIAVLLQARGNLSDAASYLLNGTQNVELLKEAKRLLSLKNMSPSDQSELFELFIQRDDMNIFLSDYQDFVAAYGSPDESDPLNWSQFMILNSDDIKRLQSAMIQREKDLDANPSLMNDSSISESHYMNGSSDRSSSDGQSLPLRSSKSRQMEYDIDLGDGKTEKIKVGEKSKYADPTGRAWSGLIIDTDTVQKTLPGMRVISYRALVMIGNLRGVGGFGTGKAATPSKAIEAAFRY